MRMQPQRHPNCLEKECSRWSNGKEWNVIIIVEMMMMMMMMMMRMMMMTMDSAGYFWDLQDFRGRDQQEIQISTVDDPAKLW